MESDFSAQEEQWKKEKTELVQGLRDSRQWYNFIFSDTELLEQFDDLKHNIGQFVNSYVASVPNVTQLELDETWEALPRSATDLLNHPYHFLHVFEAYIWERLMAVVFKRDSRAWAGSLGQDFVNVSNSVQGQSHHVQFCAGRRFSCLRIPRCDLRGTMILSCQTSTLGVQAHPTF